MTNPVAPNSSAEQMRLLSELVLSKNEVSPSLSMRLEQMDQAYFNSMTMLANSNHVIVRALEICRNQWIAKGDAVRARWASDAIFEERSRITKALGYLHEICGAFRQSGLDVTVMKSLDHWPDLGSDLDLYTNSAPRAVKALMQAKFKAKIAAQSWGDRLACKWNFILPGLSEPVEIHIQRLGQTGEQLVLASQLPARSRFVELDGLPFPVPSASDRLMISTLQRMYRHFYFRLCDIQDSGLLAESGDLDYEELRSAAERCGIWNGVATYLALVSDYRESFGADALALPQFVLRSARFRGDVMYFGKGFLRVPILPESVGLYGTQMAGLLRRGELYSGARLGLLPWLATAAAFGHKLTGSDKGIW